MTPQSRLRPPPLEMLATSAAALSPGAQALLQPARPSAPADDTLCPFPSCGLGGLLLSTVAGPHRAPSGSHGASGLAGPDWKMYAGAPAVPDIGTLAGRPHSALSETTTLVRPQAVPWAADALRTPVASPSRHSAAEDSASYWRSNDEQLQERHAQARPPTAVRGPPTSSPACPGRGD